MHQHLPLSDIGAINSHAVLIVPQYLHTSERSWLHVGFARCNLKQFTTTASQPSSTLRNARGAAIKPSRRHRQLLSASLFCHSFDSHLADHHRKVLRRLDSNRYQKCTCHFPAHRHNAKLLLVRNISSNASQNCFCCGASSLLGCLLEDQVINEIIPLMFFDLHAAGHVRITTLFDLAIFASMATPISCCISLFLQCGLSSLFQSLSSFPLALGSACLLWFCARSSPHHQFVEGCLHGDRQLLETSDDIHLLTAFFLQQSQLE